MSKKLEYRETVANLKKTWQFAKKNKKELYGYLISAVLISAVGAILPILSAQVILNLTGGKFRELIMAAAIVLAVEMFRSIAMFFARKFGSTFFRETLVEVQQTIAIETINLETQVIDKNSSGTFIDRLNKDSSDIADVFSLLNETVAELLSNFGVVIAFYIISREMFFFSMSGVILLFILKRIRMKKYFELDKKFRQISEKNTGLITELVRGVRDIKVLNASESFSNTVFERLRKSNQERFVMNAILIKYDFITKNLQDIFTFSFIVVGVLFINNDMLTVANFVVLYLYQSRIYNVLNVFARVFEYLKKFNLSSARVFEIIDGEDYPKEKFGTKHLKKVNGNFEFKNVTFGYNENTDIIKDISFKVNANETVAFVGKSGGGKTTIFSLLTKLYNINSGEILIDGIDINELDRDTIRGNISIITQNPYIFNFSIRDNLSVVKGNLTEEEMISACKKACIHDYIMRLPDQYDTMVGEGGVTLSGGQRQRLAIARALIKNTEIILFDEATSALDNQTQAEIQTAINNMRKKHTILIIAHRLSTIASSDRIILIDDGKIIAEGSHEALLKSSKEYHSLYNEELKEK